jgi:tetratricopeptide (TPR) repeat protein
MGDGLLNRAFCVVEANRGSTITTKATVQSLFIASSSFKGGEVEFLLQNRYQRILLPIITASHRLDGLKKAAHQLEHIAKTAFRTRQIELLDHVTRLMQGLALPGQEIVSAYYRAHYIKQRGRYTEARALFQRVAERGAPSYRARALQCIGATYYHIGNIDEAVSFCVLADRVASQDDSLVKLRSHWMIANARVVQEDHRHALRMFRSLEPVVTWLSVGHPSLQGDFLNDIAFALGEAGRIEEGLQLVRVALSSPYAPRFPHWAETKNELEAKREATPVLVHIDLPQENSSSPTQTEQQADYNKVSDAAIGGHETRIAQTSPESNPEPASQIIWSTFSISAITTI